MTIYSVKVNKFEVVKTTSFHEATMLAKKALVEKLAQRDKYVAHVNEKMRHYKEYTLYQIYASVYDNGKVKTFSNSVKIEHIVDGGYNWTLDRELSEMLREVNKQCQQN